MLKLSTIREDLEKCAALGAFEITEKYEGVVLKSSIFQGANILNEVSPVGQALIIAALKQHAENKGYRLRLAPMINPWEEKWTVWKAGFYSASMGKSFSNVEHEDEFLAILQAFLAVNWSENVV